MTDRDPSGCRKKILIVDDEDDLRRMLAIFLGVEDFEITECATGTEALRAVEEVNPDLILLDLGLGDMDGKTVIDTLRPQSQVPIIVLTGRSDDEEATQALRLGADDFVTKPFQVEVLLARINANLRQYIRPPERLDLRNGPIRIDLTRHEVYIHDQHVPFSPKEFELLWLFVSRKGEIITHKEILRHVWGPAHAADIQYLRVYLRQIRGKLESITELSNIFVSEAGVGYRMEKISENHDLH